MLTDPKDVNWLSAKISELKLTSASGSSFQSSIELRFYQSKRLALTVFLSDGAYRDNIHGLTTPVLINGRIGVFGYGPVDDIFRFTRQKMRRSTSEC